ncbi:hypothetical protein E5D57_001384 [Metarhizium anisopliae]|nr:hypothetical protein E5D57_001384 [Metarhizium anisopliae]
MMTDMEPPVVLGGRLQLARQLIKLSKSITSITKEYTGLPTRLISASIDECSRSLPVYSYSARRYHEPTWMDRCMSGDY